MRRAFLVPLLLLVLAVFAYAPPASVAAPPSNQAVLYQSATNTCAVAPAGSAGDTCSLTISVTYGDLLIVAAQASQFYVTDSLSTNFKSISNGGVEELWGQLSSSGSDTIQLTSTAVSNGQASLEVMEVRGLFTDYVVTTATATGSGTSLATASTAYSGFTWFCAASTIAAGTITAGTNYALVVNPGYSDFAAEYSTTVASPTTFPAASAASGTWYDAGACFARNVIHPSDIQVDQWPNSMNYFDVNEYKNSYLSVSFPNTAPTVVSPVTVPQLDPTVTGSNLLTFYLGGTSYFDTLIPSTNNTFYLPDPATANAYTINIQDLSGTFSQGASIYVQFGKLTLASGYLDASNDFDVWLPQGYYNATLVSGTSTYKAYLSMPAASGSTVQIQILKLTVNGNCGAVCTTGWNAGFAPGLTNILFGFKDSSSATSSVNDSVFVTNSTYPLGHRFYTHLFNAGPYGTITDTIACATDNCNSSIAQDISVRVIFTDAYGTFTYYTPVTNAGLFASTPNIPSSLLGLSSLFGSGAGAPTWLSMTAYFITLISTTGFGAYSAKFGVIPASALAAVFTYAGWLPLTGGAAIFLIAMAVTAFIGYLQHGR